ncbi:uroporphyrinogen-III C-methyltransferase [Chitinasiproducens palmae]|uniref:Uroporphyrinogen III methyltransferase / synthase n=1 Tax=Chitinasiproducens palmae TaxID=1770053 RepID=A0A1H2PMU3_9BURK|nr:uroporphyrinogen-III C-methyltransferase [Chitinasiproducens palmae]SDV47975.1 uroporphyrinogen III methyltransferase / synthase [Chitinasiproducens palmae]
MTDPNPIPPNAAPPGGRSQAGSAYRTAPRRAGWFAVLLLLLLIAALAAGGYWVYQRQLGLEARLASVDTQLQAARSATEGAGRRADAATQVTRDSEARLAALSTRLDEAQRRDDALESRYQELNRNRDDWMFSEIEQTLGTASQQLQLSGDTEAALRALRSADARLNGVDSPRALDVRRAIAADLERLANTPRVDTARRAQQLDQALAAIDRLPLAGETPAARAAAAPVAASATTATATSTTPAAGWTERWRHFWQHAGTSLRDSLVGLVQVRRLDRDAGARDGDPMLVSPAQDTALRENLKLRLLSARLSLLARDGATMRGDLHAADDALARYFEPNAPEVTQLRALLADLGREPAQLAPPSLDGSLNALHQANTGSGG